VVFESAFQSADPKAAEDEEEMDVFGSMSNSVFFPSNFVVPSEKTKVREIKVKEVEVKKIELRVIKFKEIQGMERPSSMQRQTRSQRNRARQMRPRKWRVAHRCLKSQMHSRGKKLQICSKWLHLRSWQHSRTSLWSRVFWSIP